jgi:hypothetical protein
MTRKLASIWVLGDVTIADDTKARGHMVAGWSSTPHQNHIYRPYRRRLLSFRVNPTDAAFQPFLN